MTKWFDTNYHYSGATAVPHAALQPDREPALTQLQEAAALSIRTRPVLLGPVSFLSLAEDHRWLRPARPALDACCRSMRQILRELAEAGAVGADG